MRSMVLGIDAGATKTDYALFDDRARLLSSFRGGTGNHEWYGGGYDELQEHLASDLEGGSTAHGAVSLSITRESFLV